MSIKEDMLYAIEDAVFINFRSYKNSLSIRGDGNNWFSIGRNANPLKEIIYSQRIPTTFFRTVFQLNTAPIK